MDIKLYYFEKGNNIPFILLHGNGGNGTYFKHQINYFSDRYRMIALDTRGHGKSPRGYAPFSIEQFSCDLNEFMEEHKITKAIILGFSDGANIAMKFAIKHPNKVKALILNGGNLNPKGVKAIIRLLLKIGYTITRLFAFKSSKANKSAEMLGLMVNEPNIDANELSQIIAPTLVICGTKDMIREHHTKQIANNIPKARLSIIKGNHYIANKCYRTFNNEVEHFLKTVD